MMFWFVVAIIAMGLVLYTLSMRALRPGRHDPALARARERPAIEASEPRPSIEPAEGKGSKPSLESLQEDFAAGRISMKEYERRVGELYGIDRG